MTETHAKKSEKPDPAGRSDLSFQPTSIHEFRQARRVIEPWVVTTPVWVWRGREIQAALGDETRVHLKLELFQRSGSFKARAALLNLCDLDEEQLGRGVTAVSAGNHAIALAYAAACLGTHAKVVMPRNADPERVAISRNLGAEVVLVDDVHQAFAEVQRIEREEGRSFIHPFEGERTLLGTGTLGLELMEEVPDLEDVIVPIGGGGLAGGLATAIKALAPDCRVWGVEPTGADSMRRSFEAGSPQAIDAVRTVADSLGAPHAAPLSFEACRRHLDGLVQVDDDQLLAALALLFRETKLAVEPAAAASTAALLGPLREKLRGRQVGLIVCGSNIGWQRYLDFLQRGSTATIDAPDAPDAPVTEGSSAP